MKYNHAQKLLQEQLQRAGLPPDVAASESGKMLAGMVAVGWIPARCLDAWEKSAHIYTLRTGNLSCTVIGVRMSIRRERVVEAVRRYVKSRRAWLKETA